MKVGWKKRNQNSKLKRKNHRIQMMDFLILFKKTNKKMAKSLPKMISSKNKKNQAN